ncbi:MAG: hypothetical protein HWE26_14605 [Alteromonadaceae bacterium]|nr:hypothetical protein [Alteromonadaceae bacterium]
MSLAVTNRILSSAAKHMKRREKFLACDNHTLSQYDVSTLVQHCRKFSQRTIESLLLASLFTGRHVKTFCAPNTRTQMIEDTEYGLLLSNIVFPVWRKGSADDPFKSEPALPPYALLPMHQIKSIEVVAGMSEAELIMQSEDVLREINKAYGTRLTPTRIKGYIRVKAQACALTQAETNWISDTPLQQHGGSSYLSMFGSELIKKHYIYINFLMETAQCQLYQIDKILFLPFAQRRIGSNFNVSIGKVRESFFELRKIFAKEQNTGNLDRWLLFNSYTYFTVLILDMTTGHRPKRAMYGELSNFDLSRRVLLIKDKDNRVESARIVPLTSKAVTQLNYYLAFLKRFSKHLRFIHPEEYLVLEEALLGRSSLFKLWVRGKLKSFATGYLSEVDIPRIDAKNNWHRHWIRSRLALHPELNPAAIDAFMGHENLLDESFSAFSSLETLELRMVADALCIELEKISISPVELLL